MSAVGSSSLQSDRCTWQALGTTVVLRVLEPAALDAARSAAEAELSAIDAACSRFRPDSELSRLNARSGAWRALGPLLAEAIAQALRAAELTGGDVDLTVGRALELAGYDRDWALLDPPGETGAGAPPVMVRVLRGWRAIELDLAGSSVRVPTGIRLDLGATAKAWAADRAAAAACTAGRCGALVSIGGDIATAGAAPAGGWSIRVTEDHRSDIGAPGQSIWIDGGGLATSSTAVRRWSHRGATMHHIIDPRTGAPVRDTWRTVSVAAATCTDANIASTAALVRAGAAPAWLNELGLPARLVDHGGRVTVLGQWPAEQVRSAA